MGHRWLLVTFSFALAACGGTIASNNDGGTSDTSDGGASSDAPPLGQLLIEPVERQVLDVITGQPIPTVTYTASFNGTSVSVGWGVDRGEVGTVTPGPSGSTVFTPSAQAGGLVKIYVNLNGEQVEREVVVNLSSDQNGPSTSAEEQAQIATDIPDLTAGGGVGGVGGDGLGTSVGDQGTLDILDAPTETGASQGLKFLYPYNATVWPRGLLAPLLQWDWSIGDVDAVKVELATTSGSFSYSGTFGRPAILTQSGGAFTNHPIPQDAWKMATDSAGSTSANGTTDELVVRLTLARGGVAYGPIEQTHKVAPARLAGTIYYQSYGTNLAKNYSGAVGGDGRFGGAVLSIKVGDDAPELAAGSDGPTSNCRVCHSVSADGSRLVAQTNVNDTTYGYSITPAAITEEPLAISTAFPAITPDGAYALSQAGQLLDLNNGGMNTAATGLENITNLGTPAFSPAGDKVIFNPMSGSAVANAAQSLVVMDYDQSTLSFSNPVEVLDTSGAPAATRPGWPAFFPEGTSVIYQQQTVAGNDGNGHGDLRTRGGSKAHLAWTLADGTGTSVALAQANGGAYLPSLASPVSVTCPAGGMDANHADDANLNYEPTVNPVASGGYAWVVFTSRRMYGNVAAIPPFCSDPRDVDLIQNITPKKLWVAAVDLNATTGTDPSHPAFYLPAQELLAGNARGFWVLDPCRQDGASCETGDQCCNGFCSQADGSGTGLQCASAPTAECSMTQEACMTTADCCNSSDSCINNFCAQIIVD